MERFECATRAGPDLSNNLTTRNHLYLGSIFFYLAGGILVLWLVWLVRRILVATAKGTPFDPANVRNLTLMGWIVVLAGSVGPVLEHGLVRWILSQVEPTELPLSPPLDFRLGVVFLGLLILVLAAVWREAVSMAEEQSLTV